MKKRGGFTFLELLMSVGIIGVLAGIVIVAIDPLGMFNKTRDAERLVNVKVIQDAMFNYLISELEMAGGGAIQEGEDNALPICASGYPASWGCVNLDSLTPSFINLLKQDPDESCVNLLGYDVYANAGRPQIIASYYGSGSVTRTSCGIPAGLVAYWKLDEDPNVTEAIDGSGSGKTATYQNSPQQSEDVKTMAGFYNPFSRILDGSTQYISTSSTDLQTATDFTISLWFKADRTSGASQHIIWQGPVGENGWGTGTSSSSNELHISIGKLSSVDDILTFFYGNDDSVTPGSGVTEIQTAFTDTASWHHVAVVVTNAGTAPSATMYLDGSSVGTDSGTHTNRAAWDTPFQIGKPGPDERYFDGYIDDVRIYTEELSSGQISAIYNGNS